MLNTFTIESADPNKRLNFTTTAGEKAVLIFPTAEKAKAFVDGQHRSVEVQIIQLTPETIHAWLAQLRADGTHDAILDPPASGEVQSAGHAKIEMVLKAAMGEATT